MAQAADAADGRWRSGQSVAAADGADSSEPQIGTDTSEPQIGADGLVGIGLRSSQYLGAADLRGVCRPSSFAGSLDA